MGIGTVDIPDFKFIPPNAAIYLYYAGRDRKYMNISRIDNAVFLDLPGFLTDSNTFDSDADIIRSLNRSAAVRRNLRDAAQYPSAGSLSSYPVVPPTLDGKVDRSFAADLGNIRTLFREADVGDVIIMTPQNHYDRLLIGEIVSDWDANQVMELPGQAGNPLPYREVSWLAHDLTRRDFPARVAKRMQNRKAISRIDRNFYEDIFKFVYPRYIWGNVSKIDIYAPSYNSADPTVNLEASELIKYAVAAYAAVMRDEVESFHALPLDRASEDYFDAALVMQIAQAFGSPGGYLAKLIGTGAAITVAAIIGMALTDETQTAAQTKQHIVHQLDHMEQNAPPNNGVNWDGVRKSVMVGDVDEIRKRYGRKARTKVGLTLHGHLPPQLTAIDSERD